MKRRTTVAIKRLIVGYLLVKLMISTGLFQLAFSWMNNLHEKENYTLDTFTDDGTIHLQSIQRQQRLVKNVKPECEGLPENLVGRVQIHTEPPDMELIAFINSEVVDGSYEFSSCKSRYRVAIIIPLRGRLKNLRHMLSHMHPIWQRQELSYTVFVITQAGRNPFNKAKLMNAGFREAKSYGQYDCFVFHDVDALLEDDRCLYWCGQNDPRHLCNYADVFHYEELWYYAKCRHPRDYLTKTRLFGGVTMFTAEQFIDVNGFSNYYWGWGGEDDDMYHRLKNKGYNVVNPYGRLCSYTLLQHPHETENAPREAKESLIYHSTHRQDKEGLNNVRYKVLSFEHKPLFINITIDVGRPTIRLQEFLDKLLFLPELSLCILRMPWNI